MRIAAVGDIHYEKYLDEFKKELKGLSEIDLFLLTKKQASLEDFGVEIPSVPIHNVAFPIEKKITIIEV